jgi:hypothetical protein
MVGTRPSLFDHPHAVGRIHQQHWAYSATRNWTSSIKLRTKYWPTMYMIRKSNVITFQAQKYSLNTKILTKLYPQPEHGTFTPDVALTTLTRLQWLSRFCVVWANSCAETLARSRKFIPVEFLCGFNLERDFVGVKS